MGGKKQSSGVDSRTRAEQMKLEQERLRLEQEAAVQRSQELELIRQQTDVQTQAYQAQTSLLTQQQAETTKRQDEFGKLLDNLTQTQNTQAALGVYEKAKQKLLEDEQASKVGAQTGLLSRNREERGILRQKRRSQATTSYTQGERRSLLTSAPATR